MDLSQAAYKASGAVGYLSYGDWVNAVTAVSTGSSMTINPGADANGDWSVVHYNPTTTVTQSNGSTQVTNDTGATPPPAVNVGRGSTGMPTATSAPSSSLDSGSMISLGVGVFILMLITSIFHRH